MKPVVSAMVVALVACASVDSNPLTAPCGTIPGLRVVPDSIADWRDRLLYQTAQVPAQHRLTVAFSYLRLPTSGDSALVASYGGRVDWYWVERGSAFLPVDIDAQELRRYLSNEPLPDVFAAVVALPLCPAGGAA